MDTEKTITAGAMLGLAITCVIVNFVYQAGTKREWARASEVTWFQITTLLVLWFIWADS